MGHPIFCLMLYSHKRRTALQGQGRVALHTDDIDTTITAEEFLNEWDNSDLQCKLKKGNELFWKCIWHKSLLEEYILGV